MMVFKKYNFLFQTGMILFAVLFSNILVDLASDGNLHQIMSRPLLFFGGSIVLSAIGGFLMVKIIERTEQKGK